jgi:carbamoyl-phosphate synthase small subunit
VLALANGCVFHGYGIGAAGSSAGEVVFNTAMTGYQEILSDPSYAQQIVTLSYPHIGNVGVNPEDEESAGVAAAGLIVREVPRAPSNWRSGQTLQAYLRERGICALAGIDTRKLTRILRSEGAQPGCIVALAHDEPGDPEALAQRALLEARAFPGMSGLDLARVVSTPWAYRFDQGSWQLKARQPAFVPVPLEGTLEANDLRVAAAGTLAGKPPKRLRVAVLDFGVKRNILRMLVDRGCEVLVLPAQTPAHAILGNHPDGVLLTNGPGDPEPCHYAIEAARELMAQHVPLFGICLGHQILGLASGARTLKMKFGHHGANHPVKDLQTGAVMITSQNHGFAIDPESLPPHLAVTHVSLFDGSIQGVARSDCPAFGFQGHPEASPGPHDLAPLFDRFIAAMQLRRAAQPTPSPDPECHAAATSQGS